MNCLSATFKYLLYFLNIVFVVCVFYGRQGLSECNVWHNPLALQLGGILLIVVGSLILSEMGNVFAFTTAFSPQTIPICIIVIGCVIFVVSFFGCCGTSRENACCTTIVSDSDPLEFSLRLKLMSLLPSILLSSMPSACSFSSLCNWRCPSGSLCRTISSWRRWANW